MRVIILVNILYCSFISRPPWLRNTDLHVVYRLFVTLYAVHRLFVTLHAVHRLFVTLHVVYRLFVTVHVVYQLFVTLHVVYRLFVTLHVVYRLFVTLHVIFGGAVCHYMLFISCPSRYMLFVWLFITLHVFFRGLFVVTCYFGAVHNITGKFSGCSTLLQVFFLAVHYHYCSFLGCYRLFCDCCYSFLGSSLDLVQVVFQFVTFHCFEFSVFFSDYKWTLDFLFLWRITIRASPFCKVNYLAVQCSSLFLINKDWMESLFTSIIYNLAGGKRPWWLFKNAVFSNKILTQLEKRLCRQAIYMMLGCQQPNKQWFFWSLRIILILLRNHTGL